MSEPFTLRMAGHELIGAEATDKIIDDRGAAWLAFVLMAHVEANNIQTPTAKLLCEWHDRRHAKSTAT